MARSAAVTGVRDAVSEHEPVVMVASLHSKLFSRRFPKVGLVLERCLALLAPVFERGIAATPEDLEEHARSIGGHIQVLTRA